jgi:hypothetical protein
MICPRSVCRVGVRHPRDSEVEDLRLACLIHQDICGLQVPMNDAALMRMIQRIADLRHQLQTRPYIEMPLFGELKQGPARNELHCEVRLWAEAAVGGAGFVNLSDSRMMKATQRLLSCSKRRSNSKLTTPRLDHFESDHPVRILLLGQIDASHAAFAEQAKDAIVADRYRMVPRSAGFSVDYGVPVPCRAMGVC